MELLILALLQAFTEYLPGRCLLPGGWWGQHCLPAGPIKSTSPPASDQQAPKPQATSCLQSPQPFPLLCLFLFPVASPPSTPMFLAPAQYHPWHLHQGSDLSGPGISSAFPAHQSRAFGFFMGHLPLPSLPPSPVNLMFPQQDLHSPSSFILFLLSDGPPLTYSPRLLS